MATIHNFSEEKERLRGTGKPRKITFYSPYFSKDTQRAGSTSLTVTLDNGDVLGVLDMVKENGGIWNEAVTTFIPWPCAYVEIEDVE
jgi:hypothetical protein